MMGALSESTPPGTDKREIKQREDTRTLLTALVSLQGVEELRFEARDVQMIHDGLHGEVLLKVDGVVEPRLPLLLLFMHGVLVHRLKFNVRRLLVDVEHKHPVKAVPELLEDCRIPMSDKSLSVS